MSGIPSCSQSPLNGADRWYFTHEELANSPSRKAGMSPDRELAYRQTATALLTQMGQELKVTELCINTAIVYMHRFYAFHSFTLFHYEDVAVSSLFLATKVEEQPRKQEHILKIKNKCQHKTITSNKDYLEQVQELGFYENVLLQTLGFDFTIYHPHVPVLKACEMIKASKDLTKNSYFLATNSLRFTSMCLQYKPTVVACFCIYLASKWSQWEIPKSRDGKHWFNYVDETVTMDLLKKLTEEYLILYDKFKMAKIKPQSNIKEKKADQDLKVSDKMNMKMYHTTGDVRVNSGIQPQSLSFQYSRQDSSSNGQLQQQQPGGNITKHMRLPTIHQHSSSLSSSSHSSQKIDYPTGAIPGHIKSQQTQQQHLKLYGGYKQSSRAVLAPPNTKYTSFSSSRTSMSYNGHHSMSTKDNSGRFIPEQSNKENNGWSEKHQRGIKRPNSPITNIRASKIPKLDTASAKSDIKNHQVINGTDVLAKYQRNSYRER